MILVAIHEVICGLNPDKIFYDRECLNNLQRVVKEFVKVRGYQMVKWNYKAVEAHGAEDKYIHQWIE